MAFQTRTGPLARSRTTSSRAWQLLGVDEKAYAQGHQYATIVYSLRSATVEYLAQGRDFGALAAYFRAFEAKELAAIEGITLDMCQAYINACTQCVPDGKDKMVFDRFHIMRQMLEAGVHFGHQTRFWNPKMAPFIFGHRNKIHIINLEKSLPMFQEAAKFAKQLAAKRGTILMVGTKRTAREIVAAEAQRAGVPYVDQRWLGGMLTNFKTVKTSLKRLKDMKAQQEAGLDNMSKKEQLMFARELEKLEKDIGGIQDMNTLPDAIFVIDVGYHKIAVAEAKKLGIPLIGVVDSNHSPEGIDYVIPGNDDSSKAVTLYARGIADAILEGRANAVDDVVKAVSESGDEFVEVDEASA